MVPLSIKRPARRFFWARPAAYFAVGLLRKRGNVFHKDGDLYICGYPRSANTFAVAAFTAANPEARLQSHRHIPAFVIRHTRTATPGIVLVRRPLDAALSWAIHQQQSLDEAVAYWNDYYESLTPHLSKLFIVRFEDVTDDFGRVMQAFNKRWGTDYTPFEHTPESAARCFQETEAVCRAQQGDLIEMMVSRPSPARRLVKEELLDNLQRSDFLQGELARANDLYRQIVSYRPGLRARGEKIGAMTAALATV